MNIEQLREQLAEARAAMQSIVDTAKGESRGLTADEATAFDTAEARVTALKADIRRLEVAETEAREAAAARTEADRLAAEARNRLDIGGEGSPAHVKSEARTYAKRNGRSYFADLALAQIRQDPDAQARIARHAREVEVEARSNPTGYEGRALGAGGVETRALNTTTGTGGAFVPPEYLEAEFVAFVREARPFADACRNMDLPRGTDSINIPKVQTGTAVAQQGSQNTAVNETDLTDAFITAPVKTMAGQQTVSLQLIEQSPINFDEMVFTDLAAALAQQIDLYVLTDAAQGVLNVSGLNSETYTDAAPTLAKLYPWVAKGIADIRTNRHAAASHMWMTPDRWYWAVSQVDANSRPLVVPNENGPFNAMAAAANGAPVYEPAGTMLGVPVYLDANIPSNLGASTNQDVIVEARMSDLFLYEGPTTVRALPQSLGNQLSVILQTYRYVAFLPNRYAASISTVTGTGLTTPTF